MPFTSIKAEMARWKAGTIHSGKGGPVVKSQRQAVAIALSEQRRAKGGLRHVVARHIRRRKLRKKIRRYV